MRKPEQLLWDAMRRNLPAQLWLQRVENLVAAGMPDVYVGSSRKWVELKVPERMPVRMSTPLLGEQHGLNVDQRNWHCKCSENEQFQICSFILIRNIDGELFLLSNYYSQSINKMTIFELRKYRIASTWPEIAKVLA